MAVLRSLLGGKVVSYHAVFAKAFKSVPAAVMLSQAFFWQENANYKDLVEIDGRLYFSKSIVDWYEETGCTEEQQKTARKILKGLGILLESLSGMPAKMHYHVDVKALVAVIYGYKQTGIPVAGIYGNKLREKPRTSSGKFRQQVAVNHGSTYKEESLESLREYREVEQPLDAPPPTVENSPTLEAEKEKAPPHSAPPPPTAAPTPAGPTTEPAMGGRREKYADDIDAVITHLNQTTGAQYRLTTKSTRAMIAQRFADRWTADDFKVLIEHKSAEWSIDPKMANYLRPETLFCPKHFESYVQAARKWKQARQQPATPNQYGQPQPHRQPVTISSNIPFYRYE